MDKIRSIVRERIRDRNSIFIFPSEVAAAFWRQEALRCSKVRAVESMRFLSWDRFKELSFSLTRPERPVNSTLRLCFIHTILAEHAERGVPLSGIIPETYRENAHAFVSHLERLLPSLAVYPSIQKKMHLLDRAAAESVSFLYHEYTGFLADHGLFEPSFEVPDLSTLDKETTIFFPELIEDFALFREILAAHPGVRMLSLSRLAGRSDLDFRYFQNSLHETRWFLNSLAELLESGIQPGRIAVTAADQALIDHLKHQAELYNIPLDFRMGDTISSYPGGRIFQRFADCVRSNFHVDDVKKLFIGGGIPWKEKEVIERLIERGLKSGIILDSVEGNPGGKRWVRCLSAAGEKKCAEFFAGVQASIQRMHNAEKPGKLREELLRFVSVYADAQRWPERDKKVFQYAADLLDGIETSLSGISLPGTLTPFKLFLYQLDRTIYVPKTLHTGIPVYPYRVGAGIAPTHHFVLGVSQEKCSVVVDHCRFLRKDEKHRLGIEDEDMSSAFLKAYAASGGRVTFSSGSETFGGKILVPEFFFKNFPNSAAGQPESAETGLFGKELLVWKAGGTFPPKLFPVQKRGFFRAEQTCLAEKKFDAAAAAVSDAGLRGTICSRLEQNGTIRFSPTGLEEFARCPFSFLFSRVLGLEEREYNTRYDDPLYLGSFAHEAAKQVYREIAAANGVFNAEQIPAYNGYAGKAVHAVRSRDMKKGFMFIPPVWDDIVTRTGKWLENLFELEAKAFNGLRVLETERRFEARVEEKNVAFHGRIDRLSGSQEETVLIDYKKKNRVKKGDIAGSESEAPISFQIPLYIFLAEAEGYSVSRAGYISLEEGKFVPVLVSPEDGKGWFSREEMNGFIEEAVRRAEAAARAVRRGNFTVAGPGCDPCRFRGVCRVKYILE